jgi:DNA-directed RNA polymerase alpha subunit
MTQFLKADTAVKVTIGPVVAVGDGFTPVTTLTLAAADEAEIIKHNISGTLSIAGNTITAIQNADGYYALDLQATDVSDEGQLTLLINDDSLCLPVKSTFMVVPANVYDSLFAVAGTDVLDVNVAQWLGTAAATPTTAGVPEVDITYIGGDAQSLTDLKDFADAGYDPGTNKVQGVVLTDTTTDVTNDVGITQTGADKAWSTAARTLTANTNFNDPTAAAIADAVLTESVDDHKGTANSLAEHIDEIQIDTNSLNDTKIPDTLSLGSINTQVGLVVSGHGLDHLLLQSVTGTDITDDSIFAMLVSKEATADWDDYVNTTDSLQAIRDRGDAAWIGGGGLTAGDINREVGLVVSGHGLDHLLLQSVTGTDVTNNSIFAKLVSASVTADWDDFVNTDDSLQAIRDRGDAAWIGGGGLTSGDINREVGLVVSGHGLDHLLLQSVTGTDITDDSIFAMLVSASATSNWDDFDNTTDSLQAIRDVEPHGTVMRGTDGANTVVPDAAGVAPTAVEIRTEMDSNSTQLSTIAGDVVNIDGASIPTTGEINTEVGLVVSGHNLDNFVFTTANKVDARVDYVGGTSVSSPNDLKADVTNLDIAVSTLATPAEVSEEVGLIVSGHGLDHLLQTSVTGTDVADDSIVAMLVSKEATADWDDYVNTTDSLQALRDQGDSAWLTAAGFSTHSAADVNREVGLVVSGHGLDNFVFTTANKVDARVDYVGANSVTTPNDFKADVSNLDIAVSTLSTPAEVSAEVGLVISGHGLDHLILQSVTGTDITDDSIIAQLASKSATADWDSYDNTSDSLEANRDEIGTAGAGLTDLGGMSTGMKAEVNAEAKDIFDTDTHAEIGQETPAATQTLTKMIQYLYKAWRNKKTQTSTTYSLFNDDASTVDQKSTVSDDTTTATIGEMTTGP